MIDLKMMSDLIDAFPLDGKIIFLGDHNQLSSIESGSVLRDICSGIQGRPSIMKNVINNVVNINTVSFSQGICLLRKNYRFKKDSGISKLANAIKNGKKVLVKNILHKRELNDIHYCSLDTKDHYFIVTEMRKGYSFYLDLLKKKAHPKKILDAFEEYRLLCAVRLGRYGIVNLNNQFEKFLIEIGDVTVSNKNNWYEGKPVIISSNNSSLRLFNGDIGIAISKEKEIRVWFKTVKNMTRSFDPKCLISYETAWAMTVHKAQGSEFKNVALVLPEVNNPILTRELLYTAVTRSKKNIFLYAKQDVLMTAVGSSTKRTSGLKNLINNMNSAKV